MKYTKENIDKRIDDIVFSGALAVSSVYHLNALEEIKRLLDEIERLQSAERWIPVTNPPPVGEFVEVTDLSDIWFAYLKKDGGWFMKDSGNTYKHFAGWRRIRPLPSLGKPLPQPPSESQVGE